MRPAEASGALLHAYFIEHRPISDPELLQEIGTETGLDPDEVSRLIDGDRFVRRSARPNCIRGRPTESLRLTLGNE